MEKDERARITMFHRSWSKTVVRRMTHPAGDTVDVGLDTARNGMTVALDGSS
jgi:hypothetical protein